MDCLQHYLPRKDLYYGIPSKSIINVIKKQSNLIEPAEFRHSVTSYAGIDEAGRGPLAGPVYAAAVVLDDHPRWQHLRDSKVLSVEKRDQLFAEIQDYAPAWSIAHCEVAEIDEHNIFYASLLAMQRAFENITKSVELAITDGKFAPELSVPCLSMVKGDRHVASISAASILAKVARDREMCRLDEEFPLYNFAKHKGYPTSEHLAKLNEHGPCCHHRTSFRPVAAAALKHN